MCLPPRTSHNVRDLGNGTAEEHGALDCLLSLPGSTAVLLVYAKSPLALL